MGCKHLLGSADDRINHWHLSSFTPHLSELSSSVPLKIWAPLLGFYSEITTNVMLIVNPPQPFSSVFMSSVDNTKFRMIQQSDFRILFCRCRQFFWQRCVCSRSTQVNLKQRAIKPVDYFLLLVAIVNREFIIVAHLQSSCATLSSG